MKWALVTTLALVALAVGSLAQTAAAGHRGAAPLAAPSAAGPCVPPAVPYIANPSTAPMWSPVAGTNALPAASPTPVAGPSVILPDPATGVLNVTLTANQVRPLSISGSPLVGTPFTAAPATPGAPASLDGPTLHVRPGGKINLTFCNELGDYRPDPSVPVLKPILANIHYHGLHVEPNLKADNIFRTFGPGESRSFVNVPTDQPAGTYWYHVHYHHLSEGQVMGGLSGLLIVDPATPQPYQLPGAWAGVPQQQLTLRDVQIPSGTNVVANTGAISIYKSSIRLLDGFYQPTFTMPTNRWEIFRLANIGADVYYQVALRPTPLPDEPGGPTTDVSFSVIGEDGLPVWRSRTEPELLLPPGKRFDVLVNVPTAGRYSLLSVPFAQGAKVESAGPHETYQPKYLPKNSAGAATTDTLATLTVTQGTGDLLPAGDVPSVISPEHPGTATNAPEYEQDLAGPHVPIAAKREFVFGYNTSKTGAMQSIINKVKYDADRAEIDAAVTAGKPFEHTAPPLADPVVNTVEQWKFVNTTMDDHPFHIHINGFQVIGEDGRTIVADGHQDIVNIPREHPLLDSHGNPVLDKNGKIVFVYGTVVIRQRFVHYTGWWVFHCHILQHEDNGMMATVEVRANRNVVPTPPPAYVMNGEPPPTTHK